MPLHQRRAQRRGLWRVGPQRIAHGHRHVAQPAFMANAADGAAFGALQKLGFSPGKQRGELLAGQAGAFVKVGQCAALGKLVPGAGQLAVVAAINAVADQRAKRQGDGPGVFDRQVGNTAPRVQPVRCDDGLRGAHGDAGTAAAAVTGGGLCGRQGQVDIDLAEEKHGPGVTAEQQRVFAAPALARAGGQFGLQHRGGVGESAVAHGLHMGGDALAQLLQAAAQHLVVVPAAGVNRHNAFTGTVQPAELFGLPVIRFTGQVRASGAAGWQIIHAHGDDTDRAGHQFRGACPFQAVGRHVVHVAMKARCQPRR